MTTYEELKQDLRKDPKIWLITGVAGFIGSNLLETLLKLNQRVIGLDNFSTGFKRNLDEVQSLVTTEEWGNFRLIEGDICDMRICRESMSWTVHSSAIFNHSLPVDFVLHQAALGSVPRSIEDPIATNNSNINGFLNILVAARDARVKRFVYAASSSTYGDHPDLPKAEGKIGMPLSPYAVTKFVNELYASVFARTYDFKSIGLRYFNIFGPRQNPNSAYAAVIPKWADAMIKNKDVYINGDGTTSRDFCFVENAVHANLLSTATNQEDAINQVYNVALGDNTSLNELFEMILKNLNQLGVMSKSRPIYRDFRQGDVRHSMADIGKAQRLLGYAPTVRIAQGIGYAMPWYIKYVNGSR